MTAWTIALLSTAVAGPPVTVTEVSWKGTMWVVAEVDLSQAQLALWGQTPGSPVPHTLGRTARWRIERSESVVFATNAGIYMEDRRPLGLHIEGGQRYRGLNTATGYGNFYLAPNGVFALGPTGAVVVPTTAWPPIDAQPWTLATQSGPLLVTGGELHPAFNPTSTSRKLRSGVGVRDPTHVVFAVSRGRVRFHDAATFFRDALHCDDALYLDGTISSWWTPERARVEGDPQGYGGVFVVTVPEPVSPEAPAPPK